ncbi:PREDICTED: uncharacterized protein LOC106812709 [Priapulus caudatus]|uniref:Uncharacterized protein LOC106812709 n=1 Tax=Priapulus caudatus TaxID=37621 RepID=A0ABM1EIW6_PRICU|nr:PREDICTED: uncharacterized protein LOC106812709 [Priapulus caudatus]
MHQLQQVVQECLDDIILYRQSRLTDTSDNLSDVLDSKLYKEMFNGIYVRGSNVPPTSNELHISTQMNTDGVALIRSSKLSVWPIYLTINEIPPGKRYTRKFRIFAGLWFGEHKADMLIYCEPLIKEFQNLYNQCFEILHCGKQLLVRTVMLSGVFDSPARSSAQGFLQFNGYNSCPNCSIPGENLKVSEKGRVTIFPFNTLRIWSS